MTRAKAFIVVVCLIGFVCFILYFDLDASFVEIEYEGFEILSKSRETKFYCIGEAPRSICFFENVCIGNFRRRSKRQSWEEIPRNLKLSITTDGDRFKQHIMDVGEWASRYLRRASNQDKLEGSGLIFSTGMWPHLYPHVWTNNLNHVFNISSQHFKKDDKLDFFVARTGKANHPYIEWPPNWMRPFLERVLNYRQSFYLNERSNFETKGTDDKTKFRMDPPEICYRKLSIGMAHIGWHDSLFTDYSDVVSFYHQRVFHDCPELDSNVRPSVIVVNRTRTKNDGKCKRCFHNYHDIDLVLSEMGDLIHYAGAYDFAQYSIQEQICMVRDVTFLIGFHGAGLINAQWMIRRPGWVFEVRFPSRTGAWFGRTSGEFGLHHVELPWESTCAIEMALRANLENNPICPTTQRLRKRGKLTFPDRFKERECPEAILPIECANEKYLMKQHVDVSQCFEYLCCKNPECPYTFQVPAKEMKVGR